MPTYCYEYPRPAVTVDVAAFTLDVDRIKLLVIRRRNEPFAGCWALPGGFLDIEEEVEDAARRELQEETGLAGLRVLDPIGTFATLGRDPRGRTISLAFGAVVPGPPPPVAGDDDAAEATWLDPSEIVAFAFDHGQIVANALTWLDAGIRRGGLGLALLPEVFTDDDLRRLRQALGFRTARQVESWRRRLERDGAIVPLEGTPPRFLAAPRLGPARR